MVKRTINVLATGTFLWALLGFTAVNVSFGQANSFLVKAETGDETWPLVHSTPDHRNKLWETSLIQFYQNRGFFEAHVDSVDWEAKIVFIQKGEQQSFYRASVSVVGSPLDMAPEWLSQTRVLSSQNLEQVFGELLSLASSQGLLSATVKVVEFQKNEIGWDVLMELNTGLPYTVEAVQLEGDTRTKPSFAAKLAGVKMGSLASQTKLSQIRAGLLSAGYHLRVGTPRYELLSDTSAVVVVPVDPRPAGSFDLSAGILPQPTQQTSGGTGVGPSGGGTQFIGSGHITLLNAFGRGRSFSAEIDRLPGQSSGVLVAVREPSFRNGPVSMDARFEGYQQDSTYSLNSFKIGIGLDIQSKWVIGVHLNRESGKPLQAGLAWIDGVQRIATSSGTFFGVETKLTALDNPAGPRRGHYFIATVESGRKDKITREIVGQDSLRVKSSERQKRVIIAFRKYWTFNERWTVLVGLDGQFAFANRLDESELVRLGGARSLRGYNENQFRGRSAARGLTELRLYSDARTYGFVFYDLGFLETRPPSLTKSTTTLYPGFGLGFAFDSAIGPISVSYALNTQEAISDGRIHLGLSFGL